MFLDVLIKEHNFVVDCFGKKFMNRAKLLYSGNSFIWEVERDDCREIPELYKSSYHFSHEELKLLVESYLSLSEHEYAIRTRLYDEVQTKIKSNKRRATTKQLEELFKNAQDEWETDKDKSYEAIVWRLIDQQYAPKN